VSRGRRSSFNQLDDAPERPWIVSAESLVRRVELTTAQ